LRRFVWIQCESKQNLLTTTQEFSIEIPDKDADAIHSGNLPLLGLILEQP